MATFWALTVREWRSLWHSPVAYVVGGIFLVLQGWVFWLLIAVLNDPRVDPSWTMAQFFFGGTFFYWFAALLVAPLLTMRTFSEEKRTGSIEFLLTAPVTDVQVVGAKFLGAWLAYCAFWGLTLVFFLFLRTLAPFDWGPVMTGYVGTWLLGAVLIALGVFTSSLTRNQVIAAVLSFVAVIFLFSLGLLEIFVRDPETVDLLKYLSLMGHLQDFGKGILDTRPVVFYASLTAIFLFLTGRVVGSPRWRA